MTTETQTGSTEANTSVHAGTFEVMQPKHVRALWLAVNEHFEGIRGHIVGPHVLSLYYRGTRFTLSIRPEQSLRIYVARPTRADVPREVFSKVANDFNGFSDLAKAVLFEREGQTPMFVMLMDLYFGHGLIVANLRAQFEHLVARVEPLLADKTLFEEAEEDAPPRQAVLN